MVTQQKSADEFQRQIKFVSKSEFIQKSAEKQIPSDQEFATGDKHATLFADLIQVQETRAVNTKTQLSQDMPIRKLSLMHLNYWIPEHTWI